MIWLRECIMWNMRSVMSSRPRDRSQDLSLLMLYVSQSDSLTDQALSGIDKLTARLHLNATKALLSPYYDPDNPPSRPFSEGEVDLF